MLSNKLKSVCALAISRRNYVFTECFRLFAKSNDDIVMTTSKVMSNDVITYATKRSPVHYDYMFKYEQSLVWVDFKNLKKEGKLVVESE